MAVRTDVVVAVLAVVAALAFAAGQSGLVRLPWSPEPAAGTRSADVRPTWTVDLESGRTGELGADLHWGMQARDQPYLRSYREALIAPGGARWEDMDAAHVAGLKFAPNQYSAWGPDAPVRKGAVFGVRTVEGNFAKLRVVDIRRNYELRIEWVLYPVAAPASVAKAAPDKGAPALKAAAPNASLAWMAARDEALAAYREQRYQEALDACGRAVEAAERTGAAHHALALATCGGLLGLHRRAASQMEEWLKQAVKIAMALEQEAIVAALGPREALLKERALRMLGVLYRDQKRAREAAEQFALAVDTVRAMPPPETAEQRLALRSDLHDLGLLLAQLGFRGTARQALAESRDYYLKTEPSHSAVKAIDEQLKRLEDPARPAE